MLFTTLFINSVFCWSPKMVTTFYSHRKVFRRHLSQYFSSNFLNSFLRSFEAYNVLSHFIHQQCFLLVTEDGHHLFLASQVFLLTSLWQFACSNFVNVLYDALKRIMLFTTLFINSVVCWSPKLVTMLSSRRKFFRWRLSDNSFLATSLILFYEALKRIMFFPTFVHQQCCLLVTKDGHNLLYALQDFSKTSF